MLLEMAEDVGAPKGFPAQALVSLAAHSARPSTTGQAVEEAGGIRKRGARKSPAALAGESFQVVDDLTFGRELTGFRLEIDGLAVGVNVVDTAGAFDQLGLDSDFLLDERRQTGSAGKVVSSTAVFDGDMHRFLLWFGPRFGPLLLTILILAAGATSLSASTIYGPVAWAVDGSIYAHYMGKLQRLTPEPKRAHALSDSIPDPTSIAVSGDGAFVALSFRGRPGDEGEAPIQAHITMYDAVRKRPLYSILAIQGDVDAIVFTYEGDLCARSQSGLSLWDLTIQGTRPAIVAELSEATTYLEATGENSPHRDKIAVGDGERLRRSGSVPGREWAALVLHSIEETDTAGLNRVEIRAPESGKVIKTFRTAKRGTASEFEYIGPLAVALDPKGKSIFIQWPRAGCQLFRFEDWKLIAHWR